MLNENAITVWYGNIQNWTYISKYIAKDWEETEKQKQGH